MFRNKIVFILIFIFSVTNLFAQNNPPPRSPLDPTNWGVVYDVPATKNVRLKADMPYFKDARLDANNPAIFAGMGQIRFAQKRYADAAPLLTKAIDGGFRNSLLYGQLAYSQLALNQNEESVKTYEKAFEMGIPPGATTRGLAYYNMAIGYFRVKENEKGFEILNKAVDEGFDNRATFEGDTDFAPVRADARFQELLKRLPPQRASQ